LVDFLSLNKSLRIEIGGHTDNQGVDSYNQLLSEKRAKSVVDYLISHQITADRLKWVGYGRSKPIADNKTNEGRAQNRRTEVKVTGM
jgi:outer membrane protein OmpA-like peptidoglycan-associated protein